LVDGDWVKALSGFLVVLVDGDWVKALSRVL